MKRLSLICFATTMAWPLVGQDLSLVPVRVTVLGGSANVTFVNVTFVNYGLRPVVAFAIQTPGGFAVHERFYAPIAGRASYDYPYSYRNRGGATVPDISQYKVVAVVFDNGTSEGSSTELTRIEGLRAGREDAASRLRPVLSRLASSDDANFTSLAESLANEVQSTPAGQPTPQRDFDKEAYSDGAREETTEVVETLQDILERARSRGVQEARKRLDSQAPRLDQLILNLHQRKLTN